MSWSLLNHFMVDDVKALLDKGEEPGGSYRDDERFFSREQAEKLIHAVLWAHGCRRDSTAGAYAAFNLYEALGLKNWTFDTVEADALHQFRRDAWALGHSPRVQGDITCA